MAAKLYRLQWAGSIMDSTTAGNVVEEWSCSLSLLSPAGTGDTAAMAATAATAVKTFHTSAGANISPTARLDTTKFNEVDITTGLQITDPTVVVYETSGNRGGGSSSVILPLQVSVRVSLDNSTRNRRARGGFYLPRPATVIGLDGKISTGVANGILAAAGTLCNSLNGIGDLIVGIWSRSGSSFTPSTRVRVGTVPDTIRRRRNDLVEVYSESPITP